MYAFRRSHFVSESLVREIGRVLSTYATRSGLVVVDPFAGRGHSHALREFSCVGTTIGVESCPEDAYSSPNTVCGDPRSLRLVLNAVYPFGLRPDAVVAVPPYRLDEDNSSPETDSDNGWASPSLGYQTYMREVWTQTADVLPPDGLLVVALEHPKEGNCAVEDLAVWTCNVLAGLGFGLIETSDHADTGAVVLTFRGVESVAAGTER